MGQPSSNMPHASLAIRFVPPESSSYQVHDAGIYEALAENSGGLFLYNGDALTPWAKVKNFGNQPEAGFPVCGLIKNQSGTTLYADTLLAGSMSPGQIDSMAFSPDWVASTNGQFTFTAKTSLTSDMYAGNDQAVVEMRVVTYPAELQYENVVSTAVRFSWNGPGGYGNRFVPPRYPCRVTGMKVYAAATSATNIFVGVLDDNGPGDSPGDTLTSATLNVTPTAMWYTVNFTTPAEITDGAFFIGAISAVSQQPTFGMDTLPPFSRQGWEYTGGWAPSRHAAIHDICIRALVQAGPGIEEVLTPSLYIPPMAVAPNPFRAKTVINFANPQRKTMTFDIYNATGIRVKTFTTKTEQVIWDGKDDSGKRLSDGVYFLKLEGGKENIEKLIIAH
jgi:hypothetical protein